jgi:cell division protein FtsW
MRQKENLTPDKKKGIWGLIDRIEGDKVVWIIVFMLIMISWLAIFSSTPLLALETHSDRLSIMKEQVAVTAFGLAVMFGLYYIQKISIFRWFSKLGFLISLTLLTILDFKLNLGFIKAERWNEASRSLNMFGLQIHIFEIIKVCMIMYLAWAIHTCKKDEQDKSHKKYFKWLHKLSKFHPNLSFLAKGISKRIIYIYLPMAIVTIMIMPGSNSSALLIGGIMGIILLLGGIKFKEILGLIVVALIGIGICFGLYKVTDGVLFGRFATFEGRISMDKSPERIIELKKLQKEQKGEEKKKTGEEIQKILDRISQPNAAKIAVHEGGIIGKGPGGSTQKYVVPVMFGDYMFSFLLEEYGLWGGILVIILYVSLLARGSWIARLCDSDFAQLAVGGLTLLITSQAFLHMFINVDLGPLTGQTLPLVSHGNGAFLSFCVAFGIILSISRMANKKIREEEEEAKPIYEKEDDIQANMDVLEQLDNIE